jgi:hypothetical protein
VTENSLAVAVHVLKSEAGPSLGQDHFERGLAALKRIAAQIVAVQLDQVEGVEKRR